MGADRSETCVDLSKSQFTKYDVKYINNTFKIN